MIRTIKIKHSFDLQSELSKALQVAKFAINNRDKLSSAQVTHIGLKSAISNQILRKYGKNRKCKSIKKVNLIIPSQSLKIKDKTLRIVPLKLEVDISYFPKFKNILQVEISKEYIFVSIECSENLTFQPVNFIGVDRNTTGHAVVCVDLSTGKILKLGKSCLHIRNKYRNLRSNAQSKGQYKLTKKLGRRETNIIKNLNHQMSSKIIKQCLATRSALVLEDLKGIRKQKSKGRKLNGMLNSWSFYQLETFLSYKALHYGVPIIKIDPHYTSQQCSRCGHLGTRMKKVFSCQHCKHNDHSDVNAAFCISRRGRSSSQDRDWLESLFEFPDYSEVQTPDEAQSGNTSKSCKTAK